MILKKFLNLTPKQKEKIIQDHLNYLLEEGVVVKMGDKYRLKTKKEIEKELQIIIKS